MKRYIFFLIVFTLVIACGKSDEKATADQNSAVQVVVAVDSAEDSRDENGWYHDWNQGIEAAKKEQKPVLVDFYTDWCQWCEVMDEKTFSDPGIKELFASDWITVKINAEDKKTNGTFKDKTMTYRQLTSSFGVSGFPSYAFFDKNGELISVITGYRETKEFSLILDFYKNEIYKKDKEFQKKYIESKS